MSKIIKRESKNAFIFEDTNSTIVDRIWATGYVPARKLTGIIYQTNDNLLLSTGGVYETLRLNFGLGGKRIILIN